MTRLNKSIDEIEIFWKAKIFEMKINFLKQLIIIELYTHTQSIENIKMANFVVSQVWLELNSLFHMKPNIRYFLFLTNFGRFPADFVFLNRVSGFYSGILTFKSW